MIGTEGVTADLSTSPRWLGRALLVLLAVAAGAAVAVAQTSPSGTIVSEVKIIGNKNVLDWTIRSKLKTKPGRPFDDAVLTADVEELTKMGTLKARAESGSTPDGRFIVWIFIDEYPTVVQEVVFKNARHLKQEEIDTLRMLHKGSPLNPGMVQKAVYDIQDFYRQKGYYFCSVYVEEGRSPGDSRIVFNVDEGPYVRVAHIWFTGNDQLATSARLLTQIDSTKMFLGLPIGGTFNPMVVDNDCQKLVDYYKANGFLSARCSREVSFANDFCSVDVIYHIREGERYKVQSVGLQGLHNIPEAQGQTWLKTKPGEFYKEADIKADEQNITSGLGLRGYQAAVATQLYYPEPGVVQVQHLVQDEQGQPSRIRDVVIIGNDVTKDRVIRRVLGLYPGQILEYPQMRVAEANLNRLGIFENSPEKGIHPTVTALEPIDGSEYRDVVVQVQEMPTGSIQLGVGVNSDSGLVGTILLNERNFDLLRPPTSLADLFSGRAFRGAGEEFRLEASPGTQYQRYTVSFREPYLFDLPYSLGVSGYYWDRLYTEDEERRTGMRIVLGHQLDRYWSISGGLRMEGVEIQNVAAGAPVDYTSVEGFNFLIGPRVAVSRDSRDSFLRPTEGSQIEASYEQIFGEFTYPILSLTGSAYWTTFQRVDGSGKQVLVARSNVSWAGSNTPVYDRFYAGGFQTIRGFEFRGVGPDVNGYKVGGDFMFLNSVEYQVPILANDNLYAVAFLDSGTVESSAEIRNYRVSAGVGLRIVVPMMGPVPIALDFGVPIVRAPSDNTQIFSFYIGVTR